MSSNRNQKSNKNISIITFVKITDRVETKIKHIKYLYVNQFKQNEKNIVIVVIIIIGLITTINVETIGTR